MNRISIKRRFALGAGAVVIAGLVIAGGAAAANAAPTPTPTEVTVTEVPGAVPDLSDVVLADPVPVDAAPVVVGDGGTTTTRR